MTGIDVIGGGNGEAAGTSNTRDTRDAGDTAGTGGAERIGGGDDQWPGLPPAPMFPPTWSNGTMVGFDLETTGVDPFDARIVSAAVVRVDRGGAVLPGSRCWLVDPGIPIPAEASAVHGITSDDARTRGRPRWSALPEIMGALQDAFTAGLPVVVFNAPYDLTLLGMEAKRLGLPPLHERSWWGRALVVDPLVMDRALDRFRSGKRTLSATAAHYGVPALDAHSAFGDAVAACAVARVIAGRSSFVAQADRRHLARAQLVWHASWAERMQVRLRQRADPTAVVDRSWPVRADPDVVSTDPIGPRQDPQDRPHPQAERASLPRPADPGRESPTDWVARVGHPVSWRHRSAARIAALVARLITGLIIRRIASGSPPEQSGR